MWGFGSMVVRYVTPRLMGATSLVFLLLTGIIWLIQLLRLSDSLASRGVTLSMMVELSVLTLPMVLSLLIPMAGVIAVVIVYRHLQEHHEMVALQALG